MTDSADTDTKTEKSAAPSSAAAPTALAVLALFVALGAAALPFIPAVQAFLPKPQTTDYSSSIGMLQHQLSQLQQAEPASAVPVDLSPITARLDAAEQRLSATEAAMADQAARQGSASVQAAAIAFLRVETRLLRGEPFNAELALLMEHTKDVTPDQARDLSAAASGVATTADLITALRKEERAARRAERLAAVDGPLDRIWAELQSLVLIKSNAGDVRTDDRFDALLAAVKHGNKGTTEAAWQALPETVRQLLYPAYGEVERRQRAELAMTSLAPVVLAVK